jgi:hypothetical protein
VLTPAEPAGQAAKRAPVSASAAVRNAEWRGFSETIRPVLAAQTDTLLVQPAELTVLVHGMDPKYMDFGPSTQTRWTVETPFAEETVEHKRTELIVTDDSAQIGGIALSVGMVWWASRVSGMIGSLLASVPAWRQIDPLPVVGRDDEEDEVDWDDSVGKEADADELAISMVLEGPRSRGLAPA